MTAESDEGARRARRSERQRAIVEAVMAEGSVRIDELAERFAISVMTVHRDLDELEARGVLRKARGVATALASSLVESSEAYRRGRHQGEKDQLAAAALDLVEPGEALFVDDSTTVQRLVERLGERAPLTVITSARTAMDTLSETRGVTLLGLGGTYTPWCNAFLGPLAIDAISRMRADTAIVSTAAVVGGACFHQSAEIAELKRAMLDAAARRILLVDHSKFAQRALHRIAGLEEFDVVLVDAATDAELVASLRADGVRIRVATPSRVGE